MKYNTVYFTIMNMIFNVTFSMEREEIADVERVEVGYGEEKRVGRKSIITKIKERKRECLTGFCIGGLSGIFGFLSINYANECREKPFEVITNNKKEIAIVSTVVGSGLGVLYTVDYYGEQRGAKNELLESIGKLKLKIRETENNIELGDLKREAKISAFNELLLEQEEKYKNL